jgi:small subunit ribosomal protein S20
VANIKSQIKRNRQNDAAHERNKAVKSALKTAVRKFREATEAGDSAVAKAANRKSAISKQASSL